MSGWSPRRRYGGRGRRPRGLWRRLFDYALTIAVFALLALVAARLDRLNTRSEQGIAVINDGDSLTLGTVRVRLRGIDAPEYTQTCTRDGADYACGRMARQALATLIGRGKVDCSGWQTDRYGRLLGDCKAGDADLNRAQVEAGWAVAYGGFEREEAAARSARRGIWAGSFVQPQEWRRTHRAEPEPRHDPLGGIANGLRELFRFR